MTARVYKHHEANPSVSWANSYELQVGTPGENGPADAQATALVLLEYEAKFHQTNVVFDRVVVSTWVPDGQPYDPATFVSVDANGVKGERASATDLIDLRTCVLARRNVAYGRAGRVLYRGVLGEDDIDSPAGSAILVPAAKLALTSLMTAAELIEGLDSWGVALVMAGQVVGVTAPNVRPIQSIQPVGVTVKKLNNRYFKRRDVLTGV